MIGTYLLIGIFNLAWAILILYSILRFPSKKLTAAFIALSAFTLIYGNSVLLIIYVGETYLSNELIYTLDKMVYWSGTGFLPAFSYFLIRFSRPAYTTKGWFWVVQFHTISLGFLVLFTGLITAGPGIDEYGNRMSVAGTLAVYYAGTFAANLLLVFSIAIIQCIRTSDELVKYQLQVVLLTSAIALFGLLGTNVLYPLVTGAHNLSWAGPLFPVIPAAGVGWLIVNARRHVALTKIPRGEEETAVKVYSAACDILNEEKYQTNVIAGDTTLSISVEVPFNIINSILTEYKKLSIDAIENALWRESVQMYCLENNVTIPVRRPRINVYLDDALSNLESGWENEETNYNDLVEQHMSIKSDLKSATALLLKSQHALTSENRNGDEEVEQIDLLFNKLLAEFKTLGPWEIKETEHVLTPDEINLLSHSGRVTIGGSGELIPSRLAVIIAILKKEIDEDKEQF